MAEQEASSKLVTGSTIFGIVAGTGLSLYLKSVDPQNRLTESLLTAIPTITLLTDKIAQKFGEWREQRRHIAGIEKALNRTNEVLQNPATPEHKQELLNKKHELEMKSIDAVQYNPTKPPTA